MLYLMNDCSQISLPELLALRSISTKVCDLAPLPTVRLAHIPKADVWGTCPPMEL